MEKSKNCPEYSGDNSIHIAVVFAEFLVDGESVKMLKRCRDNNLDYWSEKRFRDLAFALDPDIRKQLFDFCATYRNWFGEYPIKGARKRLGIGGRAVITLTTTTGGQVVRKVQTISSVRSTNTQDDQRNAAYHLDHQLDRILRESSLK